jgi:hypothetical protein
MTLQLQNTSTHPVTFCSTVRKCFERNCTEQESTPTLWHCVPCRCSCENVGGSKHFWLILANDQLDTQILFYNKSITVLYIFRATSCSSSGGQILSIQHLVSLRYVSDRPVHTCAPEGHLQRVSIPAVVLIQFDLLMMSTTLLETRRGM